MSQSKKKRRQWSPKDKLKIVMDGMDPGMEISELARQKRTNPMQYYG